MADKNVFTLDGETYDVEQVGGGCSIVHWRKKDGTIVEALMYPHSDMPNPHPRAVVKEAIARGSWA
jgi:hypothetical protein